MKPGSSKAIIFPYQSLGDTLIFSILAQNLSDVGYQVELHAPMFDSLCPWFADFTICCRNMEHCCQETLDQYDLIVCDPQDPRNLLVATLKNNRHLNDKTLWISCTCLPGEYENHSTRLRHKPGAFDLNPQANRALRCKVTKGPSLVDFSEEYCRQFLNLDLAKRRPLLRPPHGVCFQRNKSRVLIFPTTNRDKKNYSTEGFTRLARRLVSRGYQVEIAVTPAEQREFAALYPDYPVVCFRDLDHLFCYIYESGAIVSNDSGSGHIASLLHIPAATIYKKHDEFEWRPGWRESYIARPYIRLKLAGKRIWKPFISHRKIVNYIDQALA